MIWKGTPLHVGATCALPPASFTRLHTLTASSDFHPADRQNLNTPCYLVFALSSLANSPHGFLSKQRESIFNILDDGWCGWLVGETFRTELMALIVEKESEQRYVCLVQSVSESNSIKTRVCDAIAIRIVGGLRNESKIERHARSYDMLMSVKEIERGVCTRATTG